MRKAAASVDAYISEHSPTVGRMLTQLRDMIRATAPEAQEGISYSMPAYKLNGKHLAFFAAYAGHIGFYATPSCHEAFADELSMYKTGKGSVQLPLDSPLPLDLIRRMVAFRADIIRSEKPKDRKSRRPEG